jgi:integrase/recombinase XerD
MQNNQLKNVYERVREFPTGRAIIEFLDHVQSEAGLSNNTSLAYGRDLIVFAQFCEDNSIRSLDKVTAETLYKYVRFLSGKDGESPVKRSESTINRGLAAVKMLIRFGLLTGRLKDDITSVVERPKGWQKLPIVCSKEKVQALLEAPCAEDKFYLRDKAILEMLYATGARASEVATMVVSNVNLSVGYVRAIGKGQKERVIPLGKYSMAAIEDYIKGSPDKNGRSAVVCEKSGDQLFLSKAGNPLDRVEIWRIVKKYARRAGMPAKLTVHTLRHCFATHLLAGGADLRSLQELLGHADISTTQIYTHVDSDRLKKIHRQFHPRG